MLKKIAALLFMFGSAVAFAQNLSVIPVTAVPTNCYPIPLQEYQAGSTLYISGPGNTCVALGTGGGGGDTITSPNSTLSVGGIATATTLDINLAHANTWKEIRPVRSGLPLLVLTSAEQLRRVTISATTALIMWIVRFKRLTLPGYVCQCHVYGFSEHDDQCQLLFTGLGQRRNFGDDDRVDFYDGSRGHAERRHHEHNWMG